MLELDGAKIDCFESGTALLEAIASGARWNVILIDLMMPQLDGYETFEKMKRDYDYKSPVILLTAATEMQERKRSEAAGFSGFIPKPVDFQLLKREILRLS